MMFVNDLRQELNKEQFEAVTHSGSPLLVLAGAGSGKTRVLTYRSYWLINELKVKSEKITLLTFTNKAAAEMAERVKNLVGGKPIGFAGTFHTFCARLLRRHGQALDLVPGFTIYDSADQETAMKIAINNLGLDQKKYKPRMFMAVISKFKNDLLSVNEADLWAKDFIQKQTVRVWKEYKKVLKQSQALDFDDLLVRTVELLKIEGIGQRVREQFDYVLIDEYQDTNKAQFELTKLITPAAERLTVVGDASQAIYSFRGADFRNLELLKSYYENLTVIKLHRNYRSSQNILDAAYGIINNNTNHPILKLQTEAGRGLPIKIYEEIH